MADDTAVPAEVPTIILGEPPGRPAELEAPPAASVGDVLGKRFHLMALIGKGGMGRVYKAIDSQRAQTSAEDNYVAVKVLSRPFNEDMSAFSILKEEILKLRALAHPNIVRLFSCDRQDSTVFITMEYLVGRSLYTRLHSRKIIARSLPGSLTGSSRGTSRGSSPHSSPGVDSPGIDRDDAQSIITAVGGALEYAHQNLIVHGDLKPGNVIITEVGEIKVIDFGVASWSLRPRTALERREVAQRQPLSAVTPRYASPQLMARYKAETTDDIYALACLAYELMSGTHPFDDGSGTQSLTFPPPLRAGLTPPQYSAITRGLQPEKRNRTPTVRQFLDEFAEPVRRRGWKSRAVVVTVAALLAGAAWLYLQRTTAPDTLVAPTADLSRATPPPTEAQAPSTATTSAPGTVIRDCPTCPQLTVLPTGSFQQGSDASAGSAGSAYEKPRHLVTIAYPLAVANHDVTVGDFREFAAATGRDMQGCDIYDGVWRHRAKSSWRDPGFAQTDAHPVTCTSWNDAVAYAKWLSAKTGHRYRLPTASEWEYAARAGSDAAAPWGADAAAACANANVADLSAARRYPGWDVFACDDGYVNTAPVSTYKSNAFGLDDMLGNVFQWTEDCWHADYTKAPTNGTPRQDGDCTEHELRGGSWFSAPAHVRPAYRNHFATNYRTSSVGFRLVRENTP